MGELRWLIIDSDIALRLGTYRWFCSVSWTIISRVIRGMYYMGVNSREASLLALYHRQRHIN